METMRTLVKQFNEKYRGRYSIMYAPDPDFDFQYNVAIFRAADTRQYRITACDVNIMRHILNDWDLDNMECFKKRTLRSGDNYWNLITSLLMDYSRKLECDDFDPKALEKMQTIRQIVDYLQGGM